MSLTFLLFEVACLQQLISSSLVKANSRWSHLCHFPYSVHEQFLLILTSILLHYVMIFLFMNQSFSNTICINLFDVNTNDKNRVCNGVFVSLVLKGKEENERLMGSCKILKKEERIWGIFENLARSFQNYEILELSKNRKTSSPSLPFSPPSFKNSQTKLYLQKQVSWTFLLFGVACLQLFLLFSYGQFNVSLPFPFCHAHFFSFFLSCGIMLWRSVKNIYKCASVHLNHITFELLLIFFYLCTFLNKTTNYVFIKTCNKV